MKRDQIIKTLQSLKKDAKERKFNQSVDLIVALQGLDFKKPSDQIEFFLNLHHNTGKKLKICAFVAPELKDDAKKIFDKVILVDDFKDYDKKLAKKLAKQFDFFIAQATIMPKVAQVFGRYLGVRGKMPNPKAGCVVPPKGSNLKALYEKLQKTLKVSAKKLPLIQARVGTVNMPEEQVIDNIIYLYEQLIHHLPNEKNNIKIIYLKLTMSKAIKVDK